MPHTDERTLARSVASAPRWLRTLGVFGWLLAGVALFVGIIIWVYGQVTSVAIPLIVAVVLGVLFAPLVDWLARRGIPRAVGAGIVLLLLAGLVVGTVWLTAAGVVSQGEQIVTEISKGAENLIAWIESLTLPGGTGQLMSRVADNLQALGTNVLGALGTGLSSTLAFLFGMFIGAFMLYFILLDYDAVATWVASHLGYPRAVGRGIVDDGVSAMRQYFAGVTVTGVIVAALVAVAMWVLDLPLAASVAVVTWLTCYVPYVGAIVSGAFAILVALGSGGVTDAIAMVVVILLAQNVIQTIIQNQIAADRLDIHPLATLIGTLLGGIVAGLLGAMLAPALVAFGLRALRRIRSWSGPGGHVGDGSTPNTPPLDPAPEAT